MNNKQMKKATVDAINVMISHADKGPSGFWVEDHEGCGNPAVFPEFEEGLKRGRLVQKEHYFCPWNTAIMYGDGHGNIITGCYHSCSIVNDANEEVYAGTKSVSTDDFGYYTSQAAGEQYLANVRIPAAEIKAGKSASGKVYFTVYKENAVQFDEVNCDALYCLPIEDVQVTFDSFPLDLKVKDFMGSTASVIQIQGAEFKFDKDYSPQLTITITGEKKSGSSDSGYDMISYKLYDSAGYLVDSGNIYLSSLSAGDKFKDDSVVIYDITPGESYTFQLSEYSW